ncbi:DNA replication factor C, large subunit [Rhizodiscina lignyota]|uniref:Replication factor C subunit 1 n=1 Tax=Rhizodiscina lignyota TaxID=1504668 RepID=A0A9P4IAB6_9PEZI|nr:DNA replication factor C, large subunit [Rhizodiscina lignyota]
MPADIRSFFGGKPAGTPAKKDEPPAKKSQKGRKRAIVDDSDEDVVETKPKKTTPRKKQAQREPSPVGETTTTSEFFGKSKPKRSEPVKSKPATNGSTATPSKKTNGTTASSTKTPPSKPRTNGRTSSRKKNPPKPADEIEDDDHAFDDEDLEDDDVFEAGFKKGPRHDSYKKDLDEDEPLLPQQRRAGRKQKPTKADDDFEPEDEDVEMEDVEEEAVKPKALERNAKDKPASESSSTKKRKSPELDDEEDDYASPKKGKAAKRSPAKKKTKKDEVQDSAEVQAILASIPTIRAPSPPPKDGQSAKFNWRTAGNATAVPSAAGSKEKPVGAENCLAGLTFVFTGVLDSLDRTEGQELVKRYGGKVTGAPSKNTSYVVLGSDAGPKKLETIKAHGLKTINEDGLFELIRKLPANGGDSKASAKFEEKQQKEAQKVEEMAAEMEKEERRVGGAGGKASASGKTAAASGPDSRLWTAKYAPTALNQICGNKPAVEKLARWLRNFPKNQRTGFVMGGADGSGIYRAVIIHGPPGIGKTTAAHLVAELEGYDVVESNASDTRSKKLVETGLRGVLSTTSLLGYFAADGEKVEESKRKLVLIMDEVDGMSAGDRGGVGALAAVCKKTQIPMILICNERRLPKMKPFDHVTYELPFRRPTTDQIRSRIMTIAHREGLNIPGNVINALIEGSRADIRQVVNMLSTAKLDQSNMDFDQGKQMSKNWEKHVILKPWDIVTKIMGGGLFAPASKSTLNDKTELYFNDHEFSYLMLQENYLGTTPMLASSIHDPKERKLKNLELVEKAAESISDGDLVDRMIHGSQQQWSLMPTHAIFSFVRPASFIAGSMAGHQTVFTSWLGRNSTQGKLMRMIKEIQGHMRLKTSGDRHEVRQQYLPILWEQLVNKLQEEGKEGVDEVIDLMDSYFLTKDDFDAIMELGIGPMDSKDVKLETQTKAAFTRLYNQRSHPLPFMKASNVIAPKKQAKERPDIEEAIEESDEGEVVEEVKDDEDEDVDVTKDKYIKQPKKKKEPAAQKGGKGKGKKAKAEVGEDSEEDEKPKKGKAVAKGKGRGKKA